MTEDIKVASARAHVLVVEDSSVFREMQGLLLRQAGYAVSGHEHPQTALAAARERKFELVIIDYELPEMNGQQFMHELRKITPDIAIIFVSGSLTLELAIQLSKQGVAGIFNKPANPKTLLEKINETLSRSGSRDASLPGKGSISPLPAARRGNSASPFGATPVPAAASEPSDGDLAYTPIHFPGRSEAFRDLTHRLWKVRDFRAVLLLQGEPGSPFELIARDLAAVSIFRDGPIMVCDPAQFNVAHLIEVLAPTLLSTDAGTLVITGVDRLTPHQQKILTALMGSREVFLPFARRFRLVLAGSNHLSELADSSRFDETLYYKISSLSITVPSLRELNGDILLHARNLLDQHAAATYSDKTFSLTPVAATWLESQDWPGNFTELSRTLHAAVSAGTKPELDAKALETAHAKVLAEDEAHARTTPPLAASSAPARSSPTAHPFPAKPTSAGAAVPAPASAPISFTTPPAPPPPVERPAPVLSYSIAPAAHPTTPKRPAETLAARSIFRPASGSYDFSKRLAESLDTAEAATAS
jgi:DNA-binding NtrC family response regulator